jgi:tetratricopeptide (TPR) repeat protein
MNDQPKRLHDDIDLLSVPMSAVTPLSSEQVAEFLRSIGGIPDAAEAYLAVGQALQAKGYLSEAERACRTAIAARPGCSDAHTMLGVTLQAQGDLAGAVAAYREALGIAADRAETHSNLGVALQGLGRSDEALLALETSIRLDPRRSEAYANLGAVLMTIGKIDDAVLALSKAVAIIPDCAITHASLATAWRLLGNPAEAIASLRTAVALNPHDAQASADLANLLQAQGYIEEAVSLFRICIELGDRRALLYCNLGVALQDLGHQMDAVSAYQQAIALDNGFAEAHSNLGVVLLEQDKFEEAIIAFERSISLDPSNVKAYCNLGIAYDNREQSELAEAAFRKAIETDPEYADSYSNLAMMFIHLNRPDEALGLLARSASLNHDHGRPLGHSIQVPSYRIKHDYEQVSLLYRNDILRHEWQPYRTCLEVLWSEVKGRDNPRDTVQLAGETVSDLAPSYNRLVYTPDSPAIANGALNPALDVEGIECHYQSSKPEIVWMDDFLSAAALGELRRFCNEATVWKEQYANGYLGATLKGGFASPLILQIAEELRTRLPGIFGQHRLEQAWAFKYDSKMTGINVHADFAAVNVNFWITPDEACCNPGNGGLVVWNKESPRNWSFQQYNADEKHIRRFLAETRAEAVTVPYRSNRCLIFNSTLFHETDQFEFRDAYEHRRINVTLLFGKGLRMR